MSFDIGSHVGPYQITDRLGRGGMATVFKAYQQALDRYVAIKVLHAALKEDSSFLRRFSREAKVVARLEHNHIVPIYDFAEHAGYPYLVMRYIEGQTLREHLSRGSLPDAEIVRIARAIADGLDYAHSHGVLHRDIKPSNILLTNGSGVYIADFGLARIAQAGESTLSQDTIMGTPQYISPEQARGDRELDGRTDIYSFGIVLYEMITGRVPFQSDTSYAIIHAHIFDPPPRPSHINDRIGPAMEAVLLKALSKKPEDRQRTARELVAEIETAALTAETALVTDAHNAASVASPVLPAEFPGSQAAILPATAIAQAFDTSAPPLTASNVRFPEDAAQPGPRIGPLVIIGFGLLLGLALIGAPVLAVISHSDSSIARPDATVFDTKSKPDWAPASNALARVTPPAASDTEAAPAPPRQTDEVQARPVDEVRSLLAGEPENRLLFAELVLAHWQAGQVEETRRLIQENFREARTPTAYLTAAERLLEKGQPELASLILEESLAHFADDAQVRQLLLMSYILAGSPASEVEQLLGTNSQTPNGEADLVLATAYLQEQQGHRIAALEQLEDALGHGQEQYRAELLFYYGELLARAGETGPAIEAFERSRRLAPPAWLRVQIDQRLAGLRAS